MPLPSGPLRFSYLVVIHVCTPSFKKILEQETIAQRCPTSKLKSPMPIPKPQDDESKQDFMSRCMSADTMTSEFPDKKQRAAICIGQWGKKSNMQVLTARTVLTKLDARKDLIRTEKINDRTYIVAPCTCIVEGVHNQEFIAYDELAVFPDSWSGRFLPIDHPSDSSGVAVTASNPKVLQDSVVGFLFNVVARDDIRGISGEIWVDKDKAAEVVGGQDVLNKLQAGAQLEVSTGYWTFVDNTPGEWRGPDGKVEKYTQSQYGIRPDHLALLPLDTGACSWKDGCGAPRLNVHENNSEKKEVPIDHTINSAEIRKDTKPPMAEKLVVNGEQLGKALKAALAAHSGTDGTSTEMVARLAVAANIEKSRLQDLIDGKVDFAPRAWLNIFAAVLDVDPYDLFVAASNDNMNVRHNETADQKNNVTEKNPLTTSHTEGETCEPCQKTLKGKIIEILQSLGLQKTETKEEKTIIMATNADQAKKVKVDALIVSAKTHFAENNREWLMTLSDEQLVLLEPKAEQPVAETKVVEIVAAAANEKVETKVAETKVTEAVVLSAKEITDIVTAALTDFATKNPALQAAQTLVDEKKNARNAAIAQILAFETNKFDKNELETMSDSTLDKILDSLAPAHRVTSGVRQVTAADAIPAPPTILLAKPGVKGVDYAVPTVRGKN